MSMKIDEAERKALGLPPRKKKKARRKPKYKVTPVKAGTSEERLGYTQKIPTAEEDRRRKTSEIARMIREDMEDDY
jgi:hypothetical protein